MSTETDDLRDIFVDVTGAETLTESQTDEPSHDPVEESTARIADEATAAARHDGLGEAVEGAGDGDADATTATG